MVTIDVSVKVIEALGTLIQRISEPGLHGLSPMPGSGASRLILSLLPRGTCLIAANPDAELAPTNISIATGDEWLEDPMGDRPGFTALLDLAPHAPVIVIGPAMSVLLDGACAAKAELGKQNWRQRLGKYALVRKQSVIIFAPYKDEAWKPGCSTFTTIHARLHRQMVSSRPQIYANRGSGLDNLDEVDWGGSHTEARATGLDWELTDLARDQLLNFSTKVDGTD